MKKIICTTIFSISLLACFSQVTTDTTVVNANSDMSRMQQQTPSKWQNIDLTNRSNDHFMVQYGLDGWSGANDSTTPSGFSRHFNVYFLLDKPFRSNPKFSVGIGAGIGSSNIFFENKSVDLKSTSARLPFTNLDSANHFKKYKMTTVYAEAPIELRYNSNPLYSNKSFKMALGIKVGTMIDAHTKGKTLVDKAGNTVNDYISKEKSKRFFNTTKLALTGRVGYGLLSLYGAYQVTSLLKDGVGPSIRPYSIGLCISGL